MQQGLGDDTLGEIGAIRLGDPGGEIENIGAVIDVGKEGAHPTGLVAAVAVTGGLST